jgi:hypothetical protein
MSFFSDVSERVVFYFLLIVLSLLPSEHDHLPLLELRKLEAVGGKSLIQAGVGFLSCVVMHERTRRVLHLGGTQGTT